MKHGASVTQPCFNFSFAFPWYQWEQMCCQLHWAQIDSGCIWQEFGWNLLWSTTWQNLFCFKSNKLPKHGFPEPFGCEKPSQMWCEWFSASLPFLGGISWAMKSCAVCPIYNSEDTSSTSVFGHFTFYCVCRAVTKIFCFGGAEEAGQSPAKLLNFSS